MKGNRQKATWLILALSVAFLLVAGTGLYYGSRYIDSKLLRSGEAMATDIALLVKNNFQITDAEAAYMRSLTFNQMEVDPINRRLMDVGDGVALNAAVTNVYVVTPLSEEEYRYCPSEEIAGFLGVGMDTPLDGVWLLNGKMDEAGKFVVAQREDIYRYTALSDSQRRGMEQREPFGEFTTDAWGSFITGYAPLYTTEGSFVGLLGIDMDPDPYQSSARHMSLLIIVLFAVTVLMMSALFVVFYIQYTKAREGRRQFEFYSQMSHEMRTPMNGILGLAAVSQTETDLPTLHRNMEGIESSGKYLLGLINATLDYRNSGSPVPQAAAPAAPSPASAPAAPDPALAALQGRRVLLCEDHPLNAKITRKMLEKAGCATETEQDGQMGLARFRASDTGYFDAILMDIRMPVMDGLEAARRIRALHRDDARSIPIIALTANAYEEDKNATRAAGMNAHLAKPVDPRLLYRTLYDAISQREQASADRREHP